MDTRGIFEQCVRFVSDLEQRESELDLANKMHVEIDEDNLNLMVIQKLKHAIELVEKQPSADNQSRVLYYVALYANAVRKPRFGIPLCYIVVNQPATNEKYRNLAKHLLIEIKLKLPEDIYNAELQKTTLDIQAALESSHKWLGRQERHASQPPTKHVFNSDLIKKQQQNKKAQK